MYRAVAQHLHLIWVPAIPSFWYDVSSPHGFCSKSAVDGIIVKVEQEQQGALFYLQNVFPVDPVCCKEHSIKAFLFALVGTGKYVPAWYLHMRMAPLLRLKSIRKFRRTMQAMEPTRQKYLRNLMHN